MKKHFLMLVPILVATAACAQSGLSKLQPPPFDSLTGKIKYSGEVQVLSVDFITSKEELFSRALSWFKSDFSYPERFAVPVQDKVTGKIAAKVLIHYSIGPAANPNSFAIRQQQHEYWEYIISILVRDGGYEYVLTDFIPLIDKVGKRIDDWGYPTDTDIRPTAGVDSLKLAIWDYNSAYWVISQHSEFRINSLKKAMEDEVEYAITKAARL